MFILQISDLHIGSGSSVHLLNLKTKILITKLKEIIPPNSDLFCCILGDIIDAGKCEYYGIAEQVLSSLLKDAKTELQCSNFDFLILPGNHDLCNNKCGSKDLDAFNSFVSKLDACACPYSDKSMVHQRDFVGYHFIGLSSVMGQNYKYGEIDYDQFKHANFPANTIVLTHHSLISSQPDDDAVIRDGYHFQLVLENNPVIALLHGHTHGCKRYTVGNECQVIGVGPMFKEVPDISNQCNLIQILGHNVQNILTLTYAGDREKWDTSEIYSRPENNTFCGTSIYALYEEVLQAAEAHSLFNLKFQIKQDFRVFETEIMEHFSGCLEDAKIWQSFSHPDTLVYTHGELMCTKDLRWDEFATAKLQKNATNKRTIIPLLTKEASFKSEDDELVSFDVVQFGFPDDSKSNLYVTIYLRALEVRHFLPINICEVYLMAKKLASSFPSIKDITICFFAFRAEQKAEYNCYKKCKLDLMTESEICKLIVTHDLKTLKSLLVEKSAMFETVIQEQWLIHLYNAFSSLYEQENRDDVLESIRQLKLSLEELKAFHERCSDYSQTNEQDSAFAEQLISFSEMLL